MASLDRQVTQNGVGVNNAMARRMYNGVVEVTVLAYGWGCQNDEVVNVDDDLMAMMSGSVLDVEPFLISRSTLGNGKTASSKSQTSNVKMVVAGMWWWFCGSSMGLRKCNDGF
jgi:hypothetical protein